MLHKWRISFRGTDKNDPEDFLSRLNVCKATFGFSLEDLLRTLPAVFDAETTLWFDREFRNWTTFDEFVEAFRLQYGADDIQERLRQEKEHRTQGPNEDVSTYLTKLRVLLDRVRPVFALTEQLDRAYRNMHPSYRQRISRDLFVSFAELQKLGKRDACKIGLTNPRLPRRNRGFQGQPTKLQHQKRNAVCELQQLLVSARSPQMTSHLRLN